MPNNYNYTYYYRSVPYVLLTSWLSRYPTKMSARWQTQIKTETYDISIILLSIVDIIS